MFTCNTKYDDDVAITVVEYFVADLGDEYGPSDCTFWLI